MKWKRSKKAQHDAKSSKEIEASKPMNTQTNQKPSSSTANADVLDESAVIRPQSNESKALQDDELLYRPYVG